MNLDEIYLRTAEMELKQPLSRCIWVRICGLILPITTIQRYTKGICEKIMVHTDSVGVHKAFWNPDHVLELHDSH